VCQKYANTDYPTEDLNAVNSDCYEICAAFTDAPTAYDSDTACQAACKGLIDKKRRELYGVGECDHQQPYLPLIWNQTPNYFPKLLKTGLDPVSALKQCNRYCETVPNLVEECQAKCQLHFDAVEEKFPGGNQVKNTKDIPLVKKEEKEEQEKEDEFNSKYFLLFLTFLLLAVFFLVLKK